MILTELVREELIKQTEQQLPITESVLNRFVEEVKNNCDNLAEIPDIISSFLSDNFVQCEICGEYVEQENVVKTEGWHEYNTCGDVYCINEAIDRANFDPRREWGTY